jgi:predicted transcriptional regulator
MMTDHPLGGEEYVPKSGTLESSTVTWRVIVPASSTIDWGSLREAAGINRARIECHILEEPSDIKAGLALNEKIAGLTFPDITGKLDFNRGFRSSNPLVRKWCENLFLHHWNKKGKRVKI